MRIALLSMIVFTVLIYVAIGIDDSVWKPGSVEMRRGGLCCESGNALPNWKYPSTITSSFNTTIGVANHANECRSPPSSTTKP